MSPNFDKEKEQNCLKAVRLISDIGIQAKTRSELAHLIKSTEDDPEVNTPAHAILGGAVAALQGNNAAAGAMGAAAGELAAKAIMAAMYPGKSASDLNESERQTVSTLASISAGMAGGLVGDSAASAGAGAQAGKNAVENNALGDKDKKLPILDIRPGG